MDTQKLKNIVEAALLAAGRPLNLEQIQALFGETERPERADVRAAIDALEADYQGRGIRVLEVASGWRIQVREEMAGWLSRLWQDRPARYSRALLETLALIAYRQPITRGEIEDIRGVSVSSNIMRTLTERGWVRIVGHRDVPGRPAMYATTRDFLDYFGLKRLEDLPPLSEIRDLDSINVELDLGLTELPPQPAPEEEGSDHEEASDAEDAPQESARA
jgi:segregation and condensation protein B